MSRAITLSRRYARESVAALVLLLLCLAACQSDPNSPQGVAERFVDQHYVLIDVKAAKPFSTGLALHKLESEEKLTEGNTIDETTMKPTVRYRLIERRDNPEQPAFIFEGTIYVDGSDGFTRKWLITTRRENDAWKVSNFEEFD